LICLGQLGLGQASLTTAAAASALTSDTSLGHFGQI